MQGLADRLRETNESVSELRKLVSQDMAKMRVEMRDEMEASLERMKSSLAAQIHEGLTELVSATNQGRERREEGMKRRLRTNREKRDSQAAAGTCSNVPDEGGAGPGSSPSGANGTQPPLNGDAPHQPTPAQPNGRLTSPERHVAMDVERLEEREEREMNGGGAVKDMPPPPSRSPTVPTVTHPNGASRPRPPPAPFSERDGLDA